MRNVFVFRHINLRCLVENKKRKNRPLRFGLHHWVRLIQLFFRINRMCSDPMPFAEAGGLAADLTFSVPKRPDLGISDHEPTSVPADADAAISRHCLKVFGLPQCALAFLLFLFRCGEP